MDIKNFKIGNTTLEELRVLFRENEACKEEYKKYCKALKKNKLKKVVQILMNNFEWCIVNGLDKLSFLNLIGNQIIHQCGKEKRIRDFKNGKLYCESLFFENNLLFKKIYSENGGLIEVTIMPTV